MNHNLCLLCFQDIDHHASFSSWLAHNSYLCGDCLRQLQVLDLHTSIEGLPLHILYSYNEFLENMLYQYKENRDIALHCVFFHTYMKKINVKFRQYQIVIMPSSKEKIQERGFHHLREMLKDCKLPILDPFEKIGNRKQSLQSYKERQNIASYIQLKGNYDISNRPILLVDDVITTGATLKHAYHLLSGHTSKIEALVLCAHPRFVESCD